MEKLHVTEHIIVGQKTTVDNIVGFVLVSIFFILKSLLNQTDSHSLTVKFTK